MGAVFKAIVCIMYVIYGYPPRVKSYQAKETRVMARTHIAIVAVLQRMPSSGTYQGRYQMCAHSFFTAKAALTVS